MQNRTMVLAVFLILALFTLAGCSNPDQRPLGPGEIAWRVLPNGKPDTQLEGTINTKEWNVSPFLYVAAHEVAVGPKGVIRGPDNYRDTPDNGLWVKMPAFSTDGSVAGIYREEGNGDPPAYKLLTQPGYHPYPDAHVHIVPVGIIQVRTQTTEVLNASTGQTGVDICRLDTVNDLCDGSLTGLTLRTDDPQVKGILDVDILLQFSLEQLNAEKLWEMGDWAEFLRKKLVNKARGMRSLAAEITPEDFVNSTIVETDLADKLLKVLQGSVYGDPITVLEVRIRRREVTSTVMQQATAEQAAALQQIADEKSRLEAQKALDLAKIAAEAEVEAARNSANKTNTDARRQSGLMSDARTDYVICVEQLDKMGLTGEQFGAAVLGCMDPAVLQTMKPQFGGYNALPAISAP